MIGLIIGAILLFCPLLSSTAQILFLKKPIINAIRFIGSESIHTKRRQKMTLLTNESFARSPVRSPASVSLALPADSSASS